ncbi:zf-TFIIB domain-containing protein [Allosphingosinicella sp.]|uniref:TFIIB-type zinc ribbon-containing protein n=1 Tax=Allosphingosinicella sp. TaxID=2823234 RepID=UPI00378352CB
MTNPAVGMPCPVCKIPLVMSDRQGVEIDYCPQCRGVWLDRGELDKIIERSGAQEPAPQPYAAPAGVQRVPDPRGDRPAFYGDDDGHRQQRHDRHSQPRRRSFFEDLFD